MIAWEMIDLHGILTLASSMPDAFAPEAFEAMAILTESKVPGAENYYRKVIQAWPLRLEKGMEYPHWLTVENDYCTPLTICLTEQESTLLRSILLTCARLRREEKLMELAGLAEASCQFPMMIAWLRKDALRCVKKELRRVCRLHHITLEAAPAEDSQARSDAYKKLKRRIARIRKQEEKNHDPA